MIPYSTTSEKPTITGESESGRSTKAFRKPLPRMLLRTITSAQMIPNTVFTTTAIARDHEGQLESRDRAGSLIAAQAPSRSSAVRHTIIAIGPMRMSVR